VQAKEEKNFNPTIFYLALPLPHPFRCKRKLIRVENFLGSRMNVILNEWCDDGEWEVKQAPSE